MEKCFFFCFVFKCRIIYFLENTVKKSGGGVKSRGGGVKKKKAKVKKRQKNVKKRYTYIHTHMCIYIPTPTGNRYIFQDR